MATKAYNGPVEINGNSYVTRGPVFQQRLEEWPEAAPTDNTQARRSRRFLQSWGTRVLNGAFLKDRDYDGSEQTAYDSTLETRFRGQITLPGLWIADTAWAVIVPSSVFPGPILGGVPFDGNTFIAESSSDNIGGTPTNVYIYARYPSLATDVWTIAGNANRETVVTEASANEYVVSDLVAHGNYLFCVYNQKKANGRHIRRRTLGSSTWSNPLAPDPGNFPVATTGTLGLDGATLLSLGQRLYLWIYTAGTITCHYSTDDGATWTVAASKTVKTSYANCSGWAASYQNEDGTELPHLGTPEGVWRYDLDGDNPTLVVDLKQQVNHYNCWGMCTWSQTGALYIPLGDKPYGQLLEYSISNGLRITRPVGLNQVSGLPTARQGRIMRLRPLGPWLFAQTWNGAFAGEAGIFTFDGSGWHHILDTNTNTTIGWPGGAIAEPKMFVLYYNTTHDKWVASLIWRSATNEVDAARVDYVDSDPLTVSGFAFEATGYIDLARFAGDMAETNAVWLKASVDAEDLSATTAGEYIRLQYGADAEARTTNPASGFNFLSGTLSLNFASKAGISSRTLAPRLTFNRDAGDVTHSPKLYALGIDYLKVPSKRRIWRLLIDIEAAAAAQMRTAEDIIAELETIEDSVTQVTFSMPNLTQTYVKAMEPAPSFQFALNTNAPDPFEAVQREGTIELLLMELI